MKTLLLGLLSLLATALLSYGMLFHRKYISIQQVSPNVYTVVYKQTGVEQTITAHISVLNEYGIDISELKTNK